MYNESLCSTSIKNKFKKKMRTYLVVLWIEICLLVQGAQVQSLVREDSTCRGVTKSMRPNH